MFPQISIIPKGFLSKSVYFASTLGFGRQRAIVGKWTYLEMEILDLSLISFSIHLALILSKTTLPVLLNRHKKILTLQGFPEIQVK